MKQIKFDKKLLMQLLKDDVGKGDITSNAVIPKNAMAVGEVCTKQPGIIAGLEEAAWLCTEQGLAAARLVRDGAEVRAGKGILRIEGNARKIFAVERIILNIIGRMSGIATMTRKAVKNAKGVRVAATRKTLWGTLDKKAVAIGGGWPHRLRLDDGMMVKTNHLRFVDVEDAVKLAKKKGEVEVEAATPLAAINAAKADADIVMLDNFKAKDIERLVRDLRGINPKIKVEISGGISPENIKNNVKAKPDIVSLGSLTHSAKWFDVSMKITPKLRK